MTESKAPAGAHKADKDPDQQPEAVARKGDTKSVEETNKAATTGTGHSTEGKKSKPGERSAERGYIDHGNPADDGFYDTPPGAPVNEGFSDMENVDNK